MKSLYKPIAMILILLMLAACVPVDVPKTPDPSEAAHTAAPTETVTAAPADTPAPTVTPEPTPAPTETPIPTPTPNPFLPPMLGNLIGGPILPEPYKYFVLKGEGDLFYVYDTMGELVKIIADGGYYEDRSLVGIYRDHESIGLVNPILLSGRALVTDYGSGNSGIYAGIKDRKGKWLFKIYDPSLVSDSHRTEKYAPDW